MGQGEVLGRLGRDSGEKKNNVGGPGGGEHRL